LKALKWRGLLMIRPRLTQRREGAKAQKKKIKLCGTGEITGVFEDFTAEDVECRGSCGDLFVGDVV
jgi:hypothetical protein